MCKGLKQGKQGGFCRDRLRKGVGGNATTEELVLCELCSSRASLYCQADDAYLCRECDRSVHGANFLALRHIRCLLCHTCQMQTRRYLIGAAVEVTLPTLMSCAEKSQRNSVEITKRSGTLKRPFLFL